uniref:Uncharacterized protein n=1 Tax=Lotus japonicus TaxID=34305 RepID=I3T292_LOTJA|nr:unknown [Lotus japonicus]
MDYFLQNYPHKTNVHTPRETRSFQMIEGLPSAHSAQIGCRDRRGVLEEEDRSSMKHP